MQTGSPSVHEIWRWLDSVSDPEIPILSVIDLGIVRNVSWTEENEESTLVVTVTPTYSGCPAMAVIKSDIQRALQGRGIHSVRIETQLSPAWTTDWMTERGKKRLLEYGIAPPEPASASRWRGPSHQESASTLVPCPRCGSADTRLVSRFGSTPCKAFYICNSCLEPFDHFKCH